MAQTIDVRTPRDYITNFFGVSNKFSLSAKAEINTELKLIAYESEKTDLNFASRRMFEKVCLDSESRGASVRELNNKTKYIIQFPKLKGFLLENFLGYKKI
ncbi:hypothetical protein COU58_01155 [Candidatus Pacearchaeota archaeon CG10_big_fil_rev_8_21_14_0_10_32_42]|nr:MAG: hypothetical protein COU58_01155 [Candidatus Pacearchaeota archaeon CG10_big_fil_rev_8_21_14_0_10_32_42]